MTPEAIRIAVAKAMGWTEIGPCTCLASPKGRDPANGIVHHIPNYLESLDACAEFEKTLKPEEWGDYCGHINSASEKIAMHVALCFAAPPERCPAFLKVKGLWEGKNKE